MTEQEKLLEGKALQELFNNSGWKAVINIFQDLHNEAVIKLFDKEDNEARVTIKVLNDILDKVGYKIDLAESIKKDFEAKTNQKQTTSY